MSIPNSDRARVREEVLIAATQAVKDAKRSGAVLMIRMEAKRLHSNYPDCPVSLSELRQEMFRLGVADRLAIEFG